MAIHTLNVRFCPWPLPDPSKRRPFPALHRRGARSKHARGGQHISSHLGIYHAPYTSSPSNVHLQRTKPQQATPYSFAWGAADPSPSSGFTTSRIVSTVRMTHSVPSSVASQ